MAEIVIKDDSLLGIAITITKDKNKKEIDDFILSSLHGMSINCFKISK